MGLPFGVFPPSFLFFAMAFDSPQAAPVPADGDQQAAPVPVRSLLLDAYVTRRTDETFFASVSHEHHGFYFKCYLNNSEFVKQYPIFQCPHWAIRSKWFSKNQTALHSHGLIGLGVFLTHYFSCAVTSVGQDLFLTFNRVASRANYHGQSFAVAALHRLDSD